MVRRPLPGILKKDTRQPAAAPARGRALARTAAAGVCDVLHPLLVILRGLRRLAAAGLTRWKATPRERRGSVVLTGAGLAAGLALVPYGPVLAALGLVAAAGWAGRGEAVESPGDDEARTARLQCLYEALVPYFGADSHPSPLYSHGGDWAEVLSDPVFDEDGRLSRLTVTYPAYFTDGDARARARVEQMLYAKCGRGREYRFRWDEEAGRLTLAALPPLPTDIVAQRFVTSPGEAVLGFTDADAVARTVPVVHEGGTRDAPPVVWRTGRRSAEPHLLALGRPGSGVTTLLRSLALQALPQGDVLFIDGGGTGEFAQLAGRPGVMGVEDTLPGAIATLEWAARETERRLVAANRARRSGRHTPEDARRPLWLILDRPTALSHLASVERREDPQLLLQVPLRHGRAAGVTVVVGDHLEDEPLLPDTVRAHLRARVLLGPAAPAEVESLLGAPAHTTPAVDTPPGRGYARLGGGPVLRLQVPATPDPLDDSAGPAQREAVLALLPQRPTPPNGNRPAPPAPTPAPAKVLRAEA